MKLEDDGMRRSIGKTREPEGLYAQLLDPPGKNYLELSDALGRELTFTKGQDGLVRITTSLFRNPDIVTPDAIHIGVLGDLHGHLRLGLTQLERWQSLLGVGLDAIVQVGDLGLFDEQSSLDKVTLEMSEKDPEELGFRHYHRRSPEADAFFGQEGSFANTPFYFILGNHDDPGVLERGISPYWNFKCLPTGRHTARIEKNGLQISIGGLSDGYANSDLRLLAKHRLDILLLHAPPQTENNPEGDPRAGSLVAAHEGYTFFGHIHSGAVAQSIPYKELYGLNEVRHRRGRLTEGGVGYVQFSRSGSFFTYLPELPDI